MQDLDTPDGITCTPVVDEVDGPMLKVYTGRLAPMYLPSEVEEIIDALNNWLADVRDKTRAR